MTETALDRAQHIVAAARPSLLSDAEAAGYDAGFNGPNTTNCHFRHFGTPENTAAWERGKKAGDAARVSQAASAPADTTTHKSDE